MNKKQCYRESKPRASFYNVSENKSKSNVFYN